VACNYGRPVEYGRPLYFCNCLIETEGRFKVTGSHVHSKSGNISGTVLDSNNVSK